MKPPMIIAEACGNHMGQIATAKRMIEVLSRYCCELFTPQEPDFPIPGIKFQKRTPSLDLYPGWSKPHPEPYHAFGDTYLAHRQALEFSAADMATLKHWAETAFPIGIHWGVSVWDVPAADEMIGLDPKWIKVPSACNQDFDMIDVLCDNYAGEIHISTGMTTDAELGDLVSYLKAKAVTDRVVLYACTSGYPVPPEQVCLGQLSQFVARWGNMLRFGFSGHHNGIAIDMGAVALGAEFIERHFTLNRTWRGTDQAASLEPDGMRKLIRDSISVSQALARKPNGGMAEVEYEQRAKLKVSAPA